VSGAVTINGNRVYAGVCESKSLSQGAVQDGIYVSGAPTSLVVENNMVHGGFANVPRWTVALDIANVTNARIRHNTLVGGQSPERGVALYVEGTTTGTVVENNILGGFGSNALGLASACSSSSAGTATLIQSFENNLIFGTPNGLFQWFACNDETAYRTVEDMTAALEHAGASTVAGNVTVSSPCSMESDGGIDTGCILVTGCPNGGAGCLDTLIAGWDNPSGGYANLFWPGAVGGLMLFGCPAVEPPSVDGWSLVTTGTIPCEVARSSVDDVEGDGGVSTDLYGNCRRATPTMGAAELPPGASCQP
jgi:hypothetical protein